MAVLEWFLVLGISAATILVHGQSGDTMTPTKSIADGQSLISSGGTFELGFFSPGDSKNRYLGIYYGGTPDKTVVWVANRISPLGGSTGVLNLKGDGNLVLLNSTGYIIWSTGTSNAINPVVQLRDSGNLVLIEGTSKNLLWQSFDHLGNTFLPGMKLERNLRTNVDSTYTSWKSSSDPSPGEYSCKLHINAVPEILIWRGSVQIVNRIGPWNGRAFSGIPDMNTGNMLRFNLPFNEYEATYSFQVLDNSILYRDLLTETGVVQGLVRSKPNLAWDIYWRFPKDQCDEYAICGANGVCSARYFYSSACDCLRGFSPKSPQNWRLGDNSDGCVRRTALNCSSDGFFELQQMKLPDTSNATLHSNKSLEECEDWCLKNCTCSAYALTGGSRCVTWTGNLVDIRLFTDGGDNLYVRLASSELGQIRGNYRKKKLVIVIIISSLAGFLLLVCCIRLLWKKNKKRKQGETLSTHYREGRGNELELPVFDIHTIRTATNNFSEDNKLGEGGFGPVYKGQLEDGEKIAVKRLSKGSVQGIHEFTNEVSLIAKLQHRNLVRLLGCCIEGEERLLVYEYLQNTSLDHFIFDRKRSAFLDWQKRLDIILGVARGLLYLHQDSRLKIIHRDLKASNILLDEELKPKISDFGTARIFKMDQIEENTNRVVGTYGYMSPEYAMGGIFSVKSDVFSFGVLVLEILSGKKNRMIDQAEACVNLLGHAWRLWIEGRCLEILDESVGCAYPESKILRCIQVAFLCVQEGSENRPTMTEVVLMLSTESALLRQPERPGFCIAPPLMERDSSSSNKLTVTIEGR
ncbi:G-type lectin S-receptor-like serine/threonine-protein kinase At4g27290 [Elaeis guineensis]|uniref:G-type lectin S-receptor-like serine/threonine-protein kinase At4g27290 n=1 Tax=Elaeis guineensis var. tenera TaxID=51953 RepID=UPI003C6D5721